MIGAVEIYRRRTSAPVELTPTGTACAVILAWTRDSRLKST